VDKCKEVAGQTRPACTWTWTAWSENHFRGHEKASNRTANYFRSLGIKKGDKVMLVLKRRYQFWFFHARAA
jgi:acyl-coenzyme A synthetase/AMP-(fatty) acid ligase